jgi:hypothetical protein
MTEQRGNLKTRCKIAVERHGTTKNGGRIIRSSRRVTLSAKLSAWLSAWL